MARLKPCPFKASDETFKRAMKLDNTMYTVPKLEDYSPEALDRAVAELFIALRGREPRPQQRIRLEDLSRPLAGSQEWRAHPGQ